MSNKYTSVYDWLKYIKANVVGINLRELRIIEDAHAKYNISDEDMKTMCKKAVNRAMVYVNSQKSRDKAKRDAFLIYALYGLEWDDAETTDDIIKQYELLKCCEEILRDGQRKH